MKTLELIADESGERVDAFIARLCPDLTRSRIKRLIDEGLVAHNGRLAKAGVKVQAEDAVTVTVPSPDATTLLNLRTSRSRSSTGTATSSSSTSRPA